MSGIFLLEQLQVIFILKLKLYKTSTTWKLLLLLMVFPLFYCLAQVLTMINVLLVGLLFKVFCLRNLCLDIISTLFELFLFEFLFHREELLLTFDLLDVFLELRAEQVLGH